MKGTLGGGALTGHQEVSGLVVWVPLARDGLRQVVDGHLYSSLGSTTKWLKAIATRDREEGRSNGHSSYLSPKTSPLVPEGFINTGRNNQPQAPQSEALCPCSVFLLVFLPVYKHLALASLGDSRAKGKRMWASLEAPSPSAPSNSRAAGR